METIYHKIDSVLLFFGICNELQIVLHFSRLFCYEYDSGAIDITSNKIILQIVLHFSGLFNSD